ncbi:MAG TPA: lipase family protein [Marmoricola sp.]|jgi:hypothetical protein|nr:lipase family protein [Marmoricola sp.]
MQRISIVLLALATLVATALLAVPAGTASAVPAPGNDPFYDVPANIASYPDGAVIASRRITAYAYLVPMPATSWQILYRTNDSHGDPTATVVTLMVPTIPWKGAGPRPLVSYQTAEDGVSQDCAPSFGLRAGVVFSGGSAAAETGLMAAALAEGWAVTVPDYEGPDSEFLAGRLEGQAVLDGVRASLAFAPAGLPASTPVGLWGYSGGSIASSIAAQLQTDYAPALNVQGVALGGLVGDIRSTIDDFSGTAFGGAIAMGVNGPLRAFPEAGLGRYLSASGKKKIAAAANDCIAEGVLRYPGLSLADIEAFPNALDTPAVADLLRSNSPLGTAGTPTAPVYDYHAIHDELAPINRDREMMHRYCDAGVTVQHVEHALAEHISEAVTGASGALAFFSARFAGKPAVNTCASVPAD